MPQKLDYQTLIGNKYGERLFVKLMNTSYPYIGLFKCKCGDYHERKTATIFSGNSIQCMKCAKTKHGMFGTRLYRIWDGIQKRCNNIKFMHYQLYGGKGIKNEWTCFEEFISDMYTSYKEHVEIHGENNTSIDRIDGNGDYNKNNCRRATYILQNNNKDNNVKYDIGGEQLTIPGIARKYNLNKNTLYTNARNGTILDKLSLIQQ